MSVTVVVPWRGGCEWRERAWVYVRQWYTDHHPSWQVISTSDGAAGDGPWCKAAAVTAALPQATGETLVVADADVFCTTTAAAVEEVASGRAPWAVPHNGVCRLTVAATSRVYGGGPLPDLRLPRSLLRGQIAEFHRGARGGGLVVLPRVGWDRVPLDARFTGWGQEDLAWGWALARVLGAPWCGGEPLIHLWHPPQERLSRATGSTESMRLWSRYRSCYTAAEITELMAEAGCRLN